MTTILLTLFFVLLALIVPLYIKVFSDKSKKIPKEGSIILPPIPKTISVVDAIPLSTLDDVFESANLESWVCKIEHDAYNDKDYKLEIQNPLGTITMRSTICIHNECDIYYFSFHLRVGSSHTASYDNDTLDKNTILRNKILQFLWKYIIEYHEKQNETISNEYKKTIEIISKNLTSLNRERKINLII
jgi:hypothetical protein